MGLSSTRPWDRIAATARVDITVRIAAIAGDPVMVAARARALELPGLRLVRPPDDPLEASCVPWGSQSALGAEGLAGGGPGQSVGVRIAVARNEEPPDVETASGSELQGLFESVVCADAVETADACAVPDNRPGVTSD